MRLHIKLFSRNLSKFCSNVNSFSLFLCCCMTGSDSRLRLWDVQSGCDTLVNFETVRLQINKPLQLATTQDSTLVFVPCMRSVKVCISCVLFRCKNAMRKTDLCFQLFRHLTCGLGTCTQYYVATMNA